MTIESETLENAQQRLAAFVEGKRVLNPGSSVHAYNWHIKRRREEIELYGDAAAANLVPLLVRFHGRIMDAFLANQIHTKSDLAILSDSDVLNLRRPRGTVRDSETSVLIEILRDLAVAELKQISYSPL